MLKKMYDKILIKAGMILAGTAPAFAIGVDDFTNANLNTGLNNLKEGTKTGANVFMNIVTWGAIALGLVFLLWGVYLMASKDQREEGKLKDGIKLAVLGAVFLAVSFVVKKVTGTA